MKKWISDFSFISIFLVLIAALLIINATGRWKHDRTIKWDIISYYAYVPGALIYHDLTFKFVDADTYLHDKIWTEHTPDGRRVIKMSSGLAFMYTPFFLMAHSIALMAPDHFPPTGYGKIYDLFLLLSDVFYTLVGLLFLRKILVKLKLHHVVIGTTLLALYFGTNMLYYSTYEIMSHNYLFCLFAILIWKTMQWHENPIWKHGLLIGLLMGLITLVRPVDVVFGLVFLLYGVYNVQTLKDKISFFLNKWVQVQVMGICLFVIFFIQMAYWKYSTGHWLYWSYTDEGFHFTKPHILEGLFGFRKGWYIYTPLMFLATIGFFFIPRYEKKFMLAFPLTWLLFTYIIFSWWCWWYGGGLSARPYIDLYAIMGIALACLLQWVWDQRKIYFTVPGILLLSFCIWYSCLKTEQYHLGILHWDSMTFQSWKLSAFRKHPTDAYWKELKAPNYEGAARKGEE